MLALVDDEADVDEQEGRVVPPAEVDDMLDASRVRRTPRRHAPKKQAGGRRRGRWTTWNSRAMDDVDKGRKSRMRKVNSTAVVRGEAPILRRLCRSNNTSEWENCVNYA